MTTRLKPAAELFANDDPDWWCWHPCGWENASEGSIRPALTVTRGKAAAFFARETPGGMTDVRVWKRYARPLSHLWVWQEHTDEHIWRDIWADIYAEAHDGRTPDDDGAEYPEKPSEPPADWQPDEYDPVWQFVHKSHPDAIPIWVCGVKGDEPPESPKPKDVG